MSCAPEPISSSSSSAMNSSNRLGRGTPGDASITREREDAARVRVAELRRLVAENGGASEPLPPFQMNAIDVVNEATKIARRVAIRAQVAGGIASLAVSLVLYFISANNAVIVFVGIASGILAGRLAFAVAPQVSLNSSRKQHGEPLRPPTLGSGNPTQRHLS